jgi:hypothetical protein
MAPTASLPIIPAIPVCRTCGNTLFDCGLDSEPLWCGACGQHVARADAQRVCGRCRRPLAAGVTWTPGDLECPTGPKRR